MNHVSAAEHEFVVPAHQDSPYLADCLKSLRQQTEPARILLATSTPSGHIVSTGRSFGLDTKINPLRSGIAADWNFALRSSKARFVTLAHQDDVYDPTFLQRTLALFNTHPAGALCFTGYAQIDDKGRRVTSKISLAKHTLERLILGSREAIYPKRMRAFLSFGNPLPCSSVTFDREKLADFTFKDRYQSNLDWEAWLTLCAQGIMFLRVPARLVGRRHNGLTATSRLIQQGRRQAEDRDMFRKLWPEPVASAIALLYRVGY
jgi:hypothetical protein